MTNTSRITLAFLAHFFVISFLSAQNTTELYSRVKIYFDAQHSSEQLARLGVETDHGTTVKNQYLISDFSNSEIQLIENQGFKTEILINDVVAYYQSDRSQEAVARIEDWTCGNGFSFPHQTPKNFKLGSMAGFYTFQEMLNIFADMKAKYPTIISKSFAIDSFKTIENRPILYFKLSDNADKDELNETKVLYTALHHAREPASLSQMIYYIWYLLENYDKSLEIKYLVDNSELYFVPCLNPDGYIFNETNNPKGGGLWRKNRRDNGNGTMGVDLNRNYGYQWGISDSGSSPNGSSETYRGKAPFSEAETRAMKFLCEKNKFSNALNFHSYGNDLIYPWSYSDKVADTSLIQMAQVLTRYNHYLAGTTFETINYNVNGDADDWMFGGANISALTPEVGEGGFWPAQQNIIPICADNLYENLMTAFLPLQSAIVKNTTPQFVAENDNISYTLQRIGLKDGSFSVTPIALTNNVTFSNTPQKFSLQRFEKQNAKISFQVKKGTPIGSQIVFLLALNNGTFTKYDTVSTFYQNLIPIVNETGNNIANWEKSNSTWATTTKTFVSPPSSITDSPSGNYANNSANYLTSKNYIILPKKGKILLRYWIKWDIERIKDYAMMSISSSTQPAIFNPLCGKYTQSGSLSQDYHNPIYEGQSDWVQEEIDISNYAGQSILLRFEINSDDTNNNDGVYLDDIQIWAGSTISDLSVIQEENFELTTFPNPVTDILHISLKNNFFEKNVNFYLYDCFGKNILTKNIQNADKELLIDIKNIPSGTYFYQISDKKRSFLPQKIIILK
jgi:carboxypeptidase T